MPIAKQKHFKPPSMMKNNVAKCFSRQKALLLGSLFYVVLLSGCDLSDKKDFEFRPVEMTPGLEAARNKALTLCSGCHGPDGMGTADFNPNLACQKKVYMVKQLNDYRNGQRGNHIPMVHIARMLTEEEVESISEWYSLQRCPVDRL